MKYCIQNDTCEDGSSYDNLIKDPINGKRDDVDDPSDCISECYFTNEDKYIDRLSMYSFRGFGKKDENDDIANYA